MRRTLVLLLFIASCVSATPPDARLHGRVADAIGSVSNAIVTITDDTGVIASTVTDDRGNYRFDRLPAGKLTLRVTARGYAIQERTIQLTARADRPYSVRLLVPAERQTISMRELSATAKPRRIG